VTGFDGKWRETWWHHDFLELIATRAGFKGASSLLDVGCGVGHWGRTLAPILDHPETLIAGIDIEEDFVRRSRELGSAFGLRRMDYRVGAAEAIPFDDRAFDLVTCQTVLIHVRDPALALHEMTRVLKPGGTLLLAEPNNLTGYLNSLLAEPRPAWSLVKQLIDFYHTCMQGKKTLGMGDSSTGEHLPALLAQLGLREIRVAVNENCPALFPPYSSSEAQRIQVEFLKGTIAAKAWLGFGPRHNALRFFLAGGGKQTDFDDHWTQAMEFQQGVLSAIEGGSYGGGCSAVMYLISAKR
jgi:ubiquinone/menaquinone biosynthesis C-methylase UbiE